MNKYYLHIDNSQQGPFTIEELRSKRVTEKTPVWMEGLPNWVDAGKLIDLGELFQSTPPPFESAALKGGKVVGKVFWQMLSVASIAFLCLIGIRLFSQWKSSQDGSIARSLFDNEKERTRNNISTYLTVGHSSYTYYALGGVKNVSIAVTNNSDYMPEHVKVKLSYIKADGGLWKDVILDFSYVPAKNQQTIPVPDTNRGVRVTNSWKSASSIPWSLRA